MKTIRFFILVMAVGLITFFSIGRIYAADAPSSQPLYDRVLKTHTLRCSYMNYAPYVSKDPNTGKLSGSFYELTEKLGKTLNLKIEWEPETTFTTFIEDMRSGRYDVFCGGLWPIANMATGMAYSDPVFYSPYFVYVRADDHRFDGHPDMLDDPKYKMVTIDGETSAIIKGTRFTKAGDIQLPNTADVSQLLLELSGKRADFTTAEPIVAALFLKHNPGKIRALNLQDPVKVFSTVWSVPENEQKLINLLNNGIREMIDNNEVNPIVEKYHGKTFFPVAKPYTNPAEHQ